LSDEWEISVCKCELTLPDWSFIDPRLKKEQCHGYRWRIAGPHGAISDCCDSMGNPDQLIQTITGYTVGEFFDLFI